MSGPCRPRGQQEVLRVGKRPGAHRETCFDHVTRGMDRGSLGRGGFAVVGRRRQRDQMTAGPRLVHQ